LKHQEEKSFCVLEVTQFKEELASSSEAMEERRMICLINITLLF
jgi:hypothetical protein